MIPPGSKPGAYANFATSAFAFRFSYVKPKWGIVTKRKTLVGSGMAESREG